MPFELREGQGTLHKVTDKGGVESRPDYHGELMLAGKLYKIAGWIKEGKKGKWLSLHVEEPRAKAALVTPRTGDSGSPSGMHPMRAPDLDADIPF